MNDKPILLGLVGHAADDMVKRHPVMSVVSCLSLLNRADPYITWPRGEKDEEAPPLVQLRLDTSSYPAGQLHVLTMLRGILKRVKAEPRGRDDKSWLSSFLSGRRVNHFRLVMDWKCYLGIGILGAMLDTILNCDKDGFLRKVQVEDVLKFLDPIVAAADASAAIRYMKYVTALWFAKYMNEPGQKDLPVKEDPSWGFGAHGTFRKYLERKIHRRRPADAKLLYSLLQCKRASPCVAPTFVAQTYVKHRKALTTTEEVPISDELKKKIELKVIQIVSTFKPFSPDDVELRKPTRSATYDYSRESGGAFENCIDKWSLEEGLLAMYEISPGVVREVRGFQLPQFLDALDQVAHEWPEHLHCRVHGVCEPLKVRTITKSDGPCYTLVRGLQKYMWRNLVAQRQFSLIGKTVCHDDVYEITREATLPTQQRDRHRDRVGFVSGDYAGATDSLKISVTKCIFEIILAKVRKDALRFMDEKDVDTYLHACRKVLYEHVIHYPDEERAAPGHLQKTGQLMGSVLSFPILCIANLVCYWLSVGGNLAYKDLPVRVNGDDIAFAATADEYARWKEGLKDFGFVMSIGKNYFNHRFMIINSELFDCKLQQQIHYYPAGLVMGRSRVGEELSFDEMAMFDCMKPFDTPKDKRMPLAPLELVLAGAWDRQVAMDRFISFHHADWQRCTLGGLVNPFLPRSVGGLGLESCGLSFHVTPWQRRFATWCMKNDGSPPGYRPTQDLVCRKKYGWTSLPNVKLTDVNYRGEKNCPLPVARKSSEPIDRTFLVRLREEEEPKFRKLSRRQLRQIQSMPEAGGNLTLGCFQANRAFGGCITGETVEQIVSETTVSTPSNDKLRLSKPKRCRPNARLNTSVPYSEWCDECFADETRKCLDRRCNFDPLEWLSHSERIKSCALEPSDGVIPMYIKGHVYYYDYAGQPITEGGQQTARP